MFLFCLTDALTVINRRKNKLVYYTHDYNDLSQDAKRARLDQARSYHIIFYSLNKIIKPQIVFGGAVILELLIKIMLVIGCG